MKKVGILIIFFVLMSALTDAQAEVKAGSVSFTPIAGVRYFEGSQDLRTSAIFGLRAGYNFTENLGLEGFFTYTKAEIESDADWKPWQEILGYGIEGLYHFMPDGRFVPFIAIGIGGTYYGKGEHYPDATYGERFESNKFTVDYGAGVKYFLTDHIALRADVRHVIPLNSKWNNPDYFHNDFLATLGINLSFGGGKKKVAEVKSEEPSAPVKEITDSDHDGVPDYLDKCPDTPAGMAVDKDGCSAKQRQDAQAKVPDKIFIALNLKFDTGKAVVKKKYYKAVKKLADFMKKHPETKVTIHGYTDTVGTKAFNARLSKARAESVRKCLIDNFGIKASRVTAVGYGLNKPMASNDTKKGRQKNRRIEASIEAVLTK